MVWQLMQIVFLFQGHNLHETSKPILQLKSMIYSHPLFIGKLRKIFLTLSAEIITLYLFILLFLLLLKVYYLKKKCIRNMLQ